MEKVTSARIAAGWIPAAPDRSGGAVKVTCTLDTLAGKSRLIVAPCLAARSSNGFGRFAAVTTKRPGPGGEKTTRTRSAARKAVPAGASANLPSAPTRRRLKRPARSEPLLSDLR